MSQALLGVRPYPESNESLNSYLLRLAYLNGLQNIYEFLDAIDMEEPKRQRFGIWAVHQQSAVAFALSNVLNRPISIDSFPDQCAYGWYFDEQRMIPEMRVDFPRICPLCFDEHPSMDWRWGLGTVARCTKHDVPLLDTCPHCHHPFSWHTALIEGCPECGRTWKQLAKETEVLPHAMTALEHHLIPDDNGYLAATESDFRNVCRHLIHAARPHDLMQQSLQRIPYSENHSALLLNALARTESPTHFEAIPERYEYLRPSRRKLFTHPDSDQFRFHVGYKELATKLKVPKAELRHVTDAQALPRLNPLVTSVAHQIFDYREAERVLRAFEGQSTSTGTERLTVTPDTDALPQHLTSYGKLMAAVLAQKLHGYFPVPGDYSQLNVLAVEFEQWLNDTLTKECSGPIRKVVAADLLGCTNTQVMELLQQEVIQWASPDNRNFVDGRSLLDYRTELNQYTSHADGGLLS